MKKLDVLRIRQIFCQRAESREVQQTIPAVVPVGIRPRRLGLNIGAEYTKLSSLESWSRLDIGLFWV